MSPLPVSPAGPADLLSACRALFAHLPGPERDRRAVRAADLFRAGEFDPSGLLVARARGEIVGAVLVQEHPGAVAVAWPPGVEPGPDRDEVEDLLAHAAVGRLRAGGRKQAQLLLPPSERDRAAPMERAGFRFVTQLAFFCRPLPGPADAADDRLTFTPVAGPTPAFAAALMASYEGTLDCPELNGTRTADEVLAGYQSSAPPGAADWFVAAAGGDAVGVVIRTPGPRSGVHELSYLGLVPAARGRGLGRALLRFALRHAAGAGGEWLTVSADVRNEPALRLYRGHDFRQFDLQDVFLWSPV